MSNPQSNRISAMNEKKELYVSQSGSPVLEVRELSISISGGASSTFEIGPLSFAIRQGETVCLVGESGSGKSVTAKSLIGLLPRKIFDVCGHATIDGEVLLGLSDSELRAIRGQKIGMIFQEPMTALNPLLRVGEQIEEVLRIHKVPHKEARRRVLEVVEDVGLPNPKGILKRYPHQLSGGQRQRVMIASALVMNPRLLIADEPTTALDVTTQAQILRLIKALQEKYGTAVLFITHDLGVVADIADSVVVMESGRVVEQGSATRVLERPREEYTKKLISSLPSPTPPQSAGPKGEALVKIDGLEKVYGGGYFATKRNTVKAITEIDLEILGGETLGLVGESGSGKSTLARCIARLLDVTQGQIAFNGQDLINIKGKQLLDSRRWIQVVFQDPFRSLNPRKSVGFSILEPALNFGVSKHDAIIKARTLLETVKLDPNALNRYPHEFSGGQRQRLCIARALMLDPTLLVADEAVSALDVSVQAEVLNLFREIRKAYDLSILFITHDLRVAAQVCDRLAVMENGRIVEQGRTADVYSQPKSEYTKSLIDAIPGKNAKFWSPEPDPPLAM